MRKACWWVGIGLAGALSAASPAWAVQDTTTAEFEPGRRLTQWFYQGDLDRLWDRFSPDLRQVFVSFDSLVAFRTRVLEQLGREAEVLQEEITPASGMNLYNRTVMFEGFDRAFMVAWSVDGKGTIAGFAIRPKPTEAPTEYASYQTKTRLRLPFDGEWYVFWGGRTVDQNYHAEVRDQRFAYDLLVRRGRSTHTGDGSTNEQYYCFGEPILAPAPGTVVRVENGIADNRPGIMNRTNPVGNHVVLDHGNGEFSFIAHFQRGSVTVSQGDTVASGQSLGRCGNSGNSSEPHLHYHLQTTPVFGQGDGLPAQFLNYTANGALVARGEPRSGEWIENRP